MSGEKLTPEGIVKRLLPGGEKNIYFREAVNTLHAYGEQVGKQEYERGRRDGLEGIRRFLAGEKVSVSTGIEDEITYGYGELNENGYWEFPVPAWLVGKLREVLEADDAE